MIEKTCAISDNLPENFFSDPINLEGLPQQVLNSLSSKKNKLFEMTIIELINAAGGTLNLDKIIVGIFLLKQESYTRTILTSKLYHMMKKGLISRVKGKKGMYTTLNEINQ